jgi:hypothetical protein
VRDASGRGGIASRRWQLQFGFARPDVDSRHTSIGLTGSEFNEEEMIGCPLTQTGSPLAALRQPSACASVRRYRQREARLE